MRIKKVTQGHTLDVLHRYEEPAIVGLLQRVNSADVRVVQRRRATRFPLKACHPIRVGGEVQRRELQGDLALQLEIGGEPDLTNAPRTEWGHNLVATEASAGGVGHVRLQLEVPGGL